MSEETVIAENKSSKKPSKNKRPKSKLQETIEFCIPIVIAVALAFILRTFVFANAVVPTGSMLNTIQEGDRIIASRMAYNNNDPERYDIILFKYPDNEEQIYVKRIIGLPGETVQIVNGVVYVTKTDDGKTIQLDDSFVTACEPYGDFGPYVVPPDSYFMLGDNRNDSKDSRFWTNTYVKRPQLQAEKQQYDAVNTRRNRQRDPLFQYLSHKGNQQNDSKLFHPFHLTNTSLIGTTNLL